MRFIKKGTAAVLLLLTLSLIGGCYAYVDDGYYRHHRYRERYYYGYPYRHYSYRERWG